MNEAIDPLLMHLKVQGPLRTQQVAEVLAVSRQAAAQRLARLSREALVEERLERVGRGRPARRWALTAKADAQFPDTHAQVTVELIDAVREEFGQPGLDRLVSRRAQTTARSYEMAMAQVTGLEARLDKLCALRTAEGYMATWRRESDGSYALIEHHCPICAAARACKGFCIRELALFQALLAPAKVKRSEHILAGARRCAYRITP